MNIASVIASLATSTIVATGGIAVTTAVTGENPLTSLMNQPAATAPAVTGDAVGDPSAAASPSPQASDPGLAVTQDPSLAPVFPPQQPLLASSGPADRLAFPPTLGDDDDDSDDDLPGLAPSRPAGNPQMLPSAPGASLPPMSIGQSPFGDDDDESEDESGEHEDEHEGDDD